MNQPVLVRGSMANWPFLLLTLLGFIVLGLAAWAGVEKQTELAVVLGAVGLFCLILSPILRLRQKRQRLWVEDLGDGFKVIDPIGERVFRDDQVLSSALLYKNNYSNGVFKSVTRRFRVWLASPEPQPELVEMTNTMKVGESDPLADMLKRLNERLHELAKQDMASGQPVLGECWALQGKLLTLRENKASFECPLSELTAIDILEDRVCFWRQGQDEAFVRVPAETANAFLLHRLVADHLAERPKQDDKPPPEGQLGRILFERRPSASWFWINLIIAILCFLVGLGLLAAGRIDKEMGWVGLGVLAAGWLFIFAMLYVRKKLFRCHEFGVYQRGFLMGERSLQYDDVASFTYAATRQYYNGGYIGTDVAMHFEPVPEHQTQRISYSARVNNEDAALDDLRIRISRTIAARMAIRASKGEVVPWTKNLTYRPDGIEYRPAGFLGTRKEPILIPFAAISGWNLDAGYFYLWEAGKKKPTVTESASDANFFPGYFMLELLNSVSQQPASVAEVASEETPVR